MLIPHLLPDELLDGYRGRIRALNELRDARGVVEAWNAMVYGIAGSQLCTMAFAELTARHNGRRIYDVVLRHSLWPFTTAIGRPCTTQAIEALITTQAGRTATMRHARSHAWLCTECVSEDLGFWRTSYWRRSHQLPGAFWCDKHRCILGRVWTGALDSGPPANHIRVAEFKDVDFAEHLTTIPEICNFLDICAGILESDRPLDRANSAAVLTRQAIACGICKQPEDAGAALTELVRKRLPVVWCREVFPKIDWSQRNAIAMLDAQCRVRGYPASTTGIAFAAGLLFNTADDALRALYPSEHLHQSAPGPRHTRSPSLRS